MLGLAHHEQNSFHVDQGKPPSLHLQYSVDLYGNSTGRTIDARSKSNPMFLLALKQYSYQKLYPDF